MCCHSAADPAQPEILAKVQSPLLCSSSILLGTCKCRRAIYQKNHFSRLVHAASKPTGLATCIRVRGFTHPERGARPRSGRASKGLVRASQHKCCWLMLDQEACSFGAAYWYQIYLLECTVSITWALACHHGVLPICISTCTVST